VWGQVGTSSRRQKAPAKRHQRGGAELGGTYVQRTIMLSATLGIDGWRAVRYLTSEDEGCGGTDVVLTTNAGQPVAQR
jgi:hypothetical protein